MRKRAQAERADLIVRAAAIPAAFSVLSTLRFFGAAKGHGLPGAWFVETLSALGLPPNTVRQALYRLEQQKGLHSRKVGRSKIYTVTAAADAAVDVGADKLWRTDAVASWDKEWTIVHITMGPERHTEHNRILDVLRVEGFANLAGDVHIHPRERTAPVLKAARDLGVAEQVAIYRARRIDGANRREIAALWDLAAVRLSYDRFIARHEPMAARAARVDQKTAFAGRLVVVHDYLAAAWDDPDLPEQILPADWPAARARQLAQTLYNRWKGGALAFSESALVRVLQRNELGPDLTSRGGLPAGPARRSPR